MLFRRRFLDGIREGRITLAFRRWQRPSVRSGGTLLTGAGELEIARVTPVEAARITEDDARRAGFESRTDLLAELNRRADGSLYRIELGRLRPDPRIALRGSPATDEDLRSLTDRLERLDARAAEPWTLRVLDVLEAHPAVRAAELCELAGQQRDQFKRNVRKLKNLGLTESLEIGYRLSPRGAAVLRRLRKGLI